MNLRAFAFFAVWTGAVAGAQEPAPPPLQTIAEVRTLPRERAATGLPVLVRGIVTYASMEYSSGFLVDDGTGIYVAVRDARQMGLLPDVSPEWTTGSIVEISGITAPGHFAPVIVPRRIQVLGRAALPPARETNPGELLTGRLDAQRVSLRGVVQSVEDGPLAQVLDIATDAGHCALHFVNRTKLDPARLLDAEVKVSGGCFPYFNTRRELIGIRLVTDNPADVAIETAAPPDAFAAPAVTLERLQPFSSMGNSLHRRRVAGTVSLSRKGEFFYLQEGTRGIRVTTSQPETLAPGDRVEASGFVESTEHFAELRQAVFRKMGTGSALPAQEVTREKILGLHTRSVSDAVEDFNGRLVALRGRFERLESRLDGGETLYLQCDNALVPMILGPGGDAGSLRALRPGSQVRVTGVCEMSFTEVRPVKTRPKPKSFQLLLRDVADVQLLQASSWWTPRRLWIALAMTAALLAFTLGWVWALRRTLVRRTAQLAEQMRARRDAQLEFAAELRERNRLAVDLHDLVEQDLAAAAYQLEAERALRESNPDHARQHLTLADRFLTRSREDIHRSVWNLRMGVLAGRNLPDALRECALRLVEGRDVECRVTIAREPSSPEYPPFIAGNLLLLAQEGISNALKHAAPTRLDVHLEENEMGVTLTIADNGRGFDLAAQGEGSGDGHFGLSGMRERIKRLRGMLQIDSRPGGGTKVTASIPRTEIAAAAGLFEGSEPG